MSYSPMEQAKLQKLIDNRPPSTADRAQIEMVKDVLDSGEYIDFFWALNYCNKTQRLGAVIHVLRHEFGMPIIEWQPTLYGGSVYALYDYAPRDERRKWSFLDGLSEERLKMFDYNVGRQMALKGEKEVIQGQINIFEFMEEFEKGD